VKRQSLVVKTLEQMLCLRKINKFQREIKKLIVAAEVAKMKHWKSLINGTEEEQLHRKFDGMKRSIFKNLLQNSNISSRKQVQWEPANNKYSVFVDYGPLEAPEIIASEALVFLLVGLRSHWKQPIGYFLTDKATATVQAE
jgi:hypothetical protein